jgi:hypothetical protein
MITLQYAQSIIDDGTCTKVEVKQFLKAKKDILNDQLDGMYKIYDLDTYANVKRDINNITNIIQGLV